MAVPFCFLASICTNSTSSRLIGVNIHPPSRLSIFRSSFSPPLEQCHRWHIRGFNSCTVQIDFSSSRYRQAVLFSFEARSQIPGLAGCCLCWNLSSSSSSSSIENVARTLQHIARQRPNESKQAVLNSIRETAPFQISSIRPVGVSFITVRISKPTSPGKTAVKLQKRDLVRILELFTSATIAQGLFCPLARPVSEHCSDPSPVLLLVTSHHHFAICSPSVLVFLVAWGYLLAPVSLLECYLLLYRS